MRSSLGGYYGKNGEGGMLIIQTLDECNLNTDIWNFSSKVRGEYEGGHGDVIGNPQKVFINNKDKTSSQGQIFVPAMPENYKLKFNASSGTITGYTGEPRNLVIPSRINGKAVKKIGDNAFYNCESIKSLKLPNTLTEIGDYAFCDCRFTEVEIPSSVNEIGWGAFEIGAVQKLTLNEGLEYIMHGAFFKCDIKELEVPSTVKLIGNDAFSNNENLETLVIKEGVEEIGWGAFEDDNISVITIPKTVKVVSPHAFLQNPLTSITIKGDASYSGEPFEGNETTCDVILCEGVTQIPVNGLKKRKIGCLSIPSTVTEIPDQAFDYFTYGEKIDNVIIANGVDRIGRRAFYFNNLSTLKIPSSVKEIGDDAFAYNPVESLTLSSELESIGDRAFYAIDCTTLTIPRFVDTIGQNAFGYNLLIDVTIPDNLTFIGEDAFTNTYVGAVLTVHGVSGSYVEQYAQGYDYLDFVGDIESNSVYEKYDIDNSGVVDLLDMVVMAISYGYSNAVCDTNEDGIVNIFDIKQLGNNMYVKIR